MPTDSPRQPGPRPAELADDGLARWVTALRRSPGPSLRETGVQAARETAARRSRPPGPDLPLVADLRTGDGLPLRLYRPATGPRPFVLYLHGGYFVMGSLDTHDSLCRRLALGADAAVLAVDYRLAPEHRGPAAVHDAVSAFTWALARPDELGALPAAGIALAGDSAGGAIAVLAAAALRDLGTPASALLLACPNADMTLSHPSLATEGHGWGLEADDVRWTVQQWVPDPARRADPALSPVHANLAGMPPTLIATAEHDPLRDEGFTLYERLRQATPHVTPAPAPLDQLRQATPHVTPAPAPVDRLHRASGHVTHVAHPGLVHGFLGLGHISPTARRAEQALYARFARLLHSAPGPTSPSTGS
jgi:acetyl esterase